ncbi:Pesticidal crystal protein Cry1Bb [Dirofilaria immitis]
MFTISKLSTAQVMAPYGTFGAFGTPGFLNPYMFPIGGLGMANRFGMVNGFGMAIGQNPMLMSNMGMNLYNNPYLANPYVPFSFMNSGNSFTGYGAQKYGSSIYSRKQFIPGFGCSNRSGCGIGFQKKE